MRRRLGLGGLGFIGFWALEQRSGLFRCNAEVVFGL